jgi:hypothetical protein
MRRFSHWDAAHLGYFLGYACWNLAVRFPPTIALDIRDVHIDFTRRL